VTQLELTFLKRAGLSIGAHLNVSLGAPLTPAYPAGLLTERGGFDKRLARNGATWTDELHREAARREWRAQIDKLQANGIALDHLDSHHHVHLLKPLFSLALELAREYGLALRVRADLVEQARTAGVRSPDCLAEGYFGVDNIGRESLLAEIENAPGATVELMCHPGLADGLLKLRSGYVMERELELATLCDTRLIEEVGIKGWILGGYDITG
jgi:predicted glycoside hydrolase/deacetylase ChbG (UPF0249 family)